MRSLILICLTLMLTISPTYALTPIAIGKPGTVSKEAEIVLGEMDRNFTVRGDKVFAGDVLAGTKADFDIYKQKIRSGVIKPQAVAAAPGECRSGWWIFCSSSFGRPWTNGVVGIDRASFYRYFGSEINKRIMREVFAEIYARSGVRAELRTSGNRIQIISDGNNCYSKIGQMGGVQTMSIANCTQATILHEFGHALGLIHEHQRCDRDNYIRIDPRFFSAAYKKDSGDIVPKWCFHSRHFGTAYDYSSSMHYHSFGVTDPAAMKNGNYAITKKGSMRNKLIYEPKHLSYNDGRTIASHNKTKIPSQAQKMFYSLYLKNAFK